MAQRALVIGSQTNLRGPRGDAERTAAALKAIGFADIDLRISDADTSRNGILDGYAELIKASSAGDVAVIYYSGHGARVQPAAGTTDLPPSARRPTQCIVPSDYLDSTPDDFRGITDVELSVLQAQLTRRTANTTVILDCCFAAGASRTHAVNKAMLPGHLDMHRHIERAVKAGLEVDLLDGLGNQRAVRLVAAGQSQMAFEQPFKDEVRGVFTEALLEAIGKAKSQKDARVTWAELILGVREKVIAINGMQRPEVEGPGRRYVFEIEEAPQNGAVAIARDAAGRSIIRAGRLHGVHSGDEYIVVPFDTTDKEARTGHATVQEVGWASSVVSVAPVAPATAIELPAYAMRVGSAAPDRAVCVVGDDPRRAKVEQALIAAPRLQPVGEASDLPILATVRVHGGALELIGPGNIALLPPAELTDANIRILIDNLYTLSAARAMRELPASNHELPASAVEISWGRVEDGAASPLPVDGTVITVGERLFVRVKNTHPRKLPLFVHVFDIGITQRVERLTRSWGAGYELAYGETYTAGENNHGALVGLTTSWPYELGRDMRRSESLVVIVTDERVDLGLLEQPGMKSFWGTKGVNRDVLEPGLIQLMRHVLKGATRDSGLADQNPSYLVHRIDFDMQPWPSGGGFLVDDRPAARDMGPPTRSAGVPRALPSERTLALRIAELTIHENRALFGNADVRLDTLVITRAASQGDEPYRTETHRFNRIGDNELLPIENLLVFHGPVRDFVDFRVWVSRDVAHSRTLAELFKEQMTSTELQTAATALLAVTTVAAAAPIVAATGAVATLTAIAWRVLSEALPRSIGLYQTSLLAHEGDGFGAGMHPPAGSFRAQDFSLRYEVSLIS